MLELTSAVIVALWLNPAPGAVSVPDPNARVNRGGQTQAEKLKAEAAAAAAKAAAAKAAAAKAAAAGK